MVVTIQISFKTINQGKERKEDLTAIKLINGKYPDFFQDHFKGKGESLFYGLKVNSCGRMVRAS